MELDKTPARAICHLFFHCCGKDGSFDEKEIDWISAKFVELGINHDIDFKVEMRTYTNERAGQLDELEHMKSLIAAIRPVNTLALYSWCVEICLCDELLSMEEQTLLENIATALQIEMAQKDAIKAVIVEREVVKINKIV